MDHAFRSIPGPCFHSRSPNRACCRAVGRIRQVAIADFHPNPQRLRRTIGKPDFVKLPSAVRRFRVVGPLLGHIGAGIRQTCPFRRAPERVTRCRPRANLTECAASRGPRTTARLRSSIASAERHPPPNRPIPQPAAKSRSRQVNNHESSNSQRLTPGHFTTSKRQDFLDQFADLLELRRTGAFAPFEEGRFRRGQRGAGQFEPA